MSLARGEAIFELRGPFGRRVVGLVGGRAAIRDVDEFLRGLSAIDQKAGTTSQAFDASRVAGAEHLVHAARLALIARATKSNFASSLGIELVCWVAAERQIERAFEKVGVHQGRGELAIVTIGASRARVRALMAKISSELGLERDDLVFKLRPNKIPVLRKTFSISQKELAVAPIQKLVLERIALLILSR